MARKSLTSQQTTSNNNNNSNSNNQNQTLKTICEIFKETVGEASELGLKSTFTSSFIQLDKALMRSRDANEFAESFIYPIKLYLCCPSSKDSKTTATCRFISKYLVYLYNSSSSSISTSSQSTTTNNNTANNNNNNNNKNIELIKQKKRQSKDAVLSFLYTVLDSKETVVRHRSLQLLNNILSDPDTKTELFDIDKKSNYMDIKSILDTRCIDKNVNIRLSAVNVTVKYYMNKKDQSYFEEVLEMMDSDSVWNIRNTLLKQIVPFAVAVKFDTLDLIQHVIRRTKDIKLEVRSTAYNILSKWYKMDDFTSEQIIEVISQGLNDPEPKVKEASLDLLTSWLNKLKSENPNHYLYIYLEKIDVVENGPFLERSLLAVYEKAGLDDFALRLCRKDITNEQAFHHKLTVHHLTSVSVPNASKYLLMERLDELLPTLTEYRDILLAHLGEFYVLGQLLEALQSLDFGDEVGRTNMEVFLLQILRVVKCQGVDESSAEKEFQLIKQTLSCLSLVIGIERTFILQMVELLSDLLDPLEVDPNITKLEELEAIDKKSIKNKKEWQTIQTQINQLKQIIQSSKTQAILKCSIITHYLLLNAKKFSNSPEIDGLLQLVILPSIQHPLPNLRKLGVQNLGIFCLHRRNAALNYLNLFEKILETDTPEIQLACLRVVFDIILVFGSPKTIPKETVPLYKMIRKYSQVSTNDETKIICIEGFVKLLYSGIVQDQKYVAYFKIGRTVGQGIELCADQFD
ncbi:hypothetical protein DFA_03444 [Cavenderia fasciculata]|uniref:Nuclear condensin complex subunit 3 C-terminal domain-containing protein n=1 Tax=Cavenderia fasciculata TaxID=261658 RepID=F4PHL2_CACFS|nr:uncharacterized protein DFA_03444 [Cavenderia fasciculata]EGG25196.1 hypothetical protein DFA_03444 [Cavenderia fasciculata]|eukprot:XP_004363047.1 hypothetical protein DFA_03444 [Cavenderia fasciculata]